MIVNELRECLHEVQRLIDEVKARAERSYEVVELGCSPYAAMDINGRPLLAELLVAKAHLLVALAAAAPA